MKPKKLMLLGGLRYLLPVIKAAHELGIYVITVDYLPDNIAHKYSDEYHNVSILDKDAVLSLARQLDIDGIMSFAVDPGVVCAAYVADKMALPSPPLESVQILQDKSRFRHFLETNGFNVPKSKGYDNDNISQVFKDVDYFTWPVIVKPVDSAGSKGVMRVNNPQDLKIAINNALGNSHTGRIIIEDFIEKDGYSTDTDSFSVDSELRFVSFNNQFFDDSAKNPYTPSAFSWPSKMPKRYQDELASEISRLIKLLNMGTSVYNIETRVGKDGKAYIMELSPRGGGNRLCEMLRYATGVDLIKNAVKAAVGIKDIDVVQAPYKGHWAEVILHGDRSGIFSGLDISKEVEPYVVERDLWVKTGDDIKNFNGANDAIGTLVLNFDSQKQLFDKMNHQSDWLTIKIE
jgi:biotin carboxylase